MCFLLFYHVYIDVFVCHGDAVALKAFAHALVHGVVYAPVVLTVDPDTHSVVDGTGLVLFETHKGGGLGEYALVGKYCLHNGGFDLLGAVVIGRGENHINAAGGLGVVVYKGGGGNVGVGDGDGLVVAGGDNGVEKPDALHSAGLPGNINEVTGGKGLGHQQRDAGEKVCHDVLHRKAQCKAGHAEQGHKACGGDAQCVRHDYGRQQPQHYFDCRTDEAPQGVVQLSGAFQQLVCKGGDYPHHNKAEDECAQCGQKLAHSQAEASQVYHVACEIHFYSLFFGSLYVEYSDHQACNDNKGRAKYGPDPHRFMEYKYAHDDAGGGFEGAEYGAALAADDESGLLEQHHRAGSHQHCKEEAQRPAAGCGGQGQIAADKAGDECENTGHGGHVEAEQKAGDLAVFEAGQQYDVGGEGQARGQSQNTALRVKGLAGGVEQRHAHRTDDNAEYIAKLGLFTQE